MHNSSKILNNKTFDIFGLHLGHMTDLLVVALCQFRRHPSALEDNLQLSKYSWN